MCANAPPGGGSLSLCFRSTAKMTTYCLKKSKLQKNCGFDFLNKIDKLFNPELLILHIFQQTTASVSLYMIFLFN